MTINIEITVQPELDNLEDIHKACFPRHWKADDFRSLLELPGTVAFVAETGFGLLRLTVDEAEILTLAVLPQAQRQGVASGIVQRMQQWLVENGGRSLFLEVRQSNAAAIGLYKKAGFEQVARRERYYENTEAAIVMKYSIS